MSETPANGLRSISAGLEAALHLLTMTLSAVVLLNQTGRDGTHATGVVVTTAAFLATYAWGVWPHGNLPLPGERGWAWTASLTVEWSALLSLTVDATYLAFVLFFLYMRLLGALWGTAAVLATSVLAATAFGLHRGFDLAGVVGHALGAGVAIVIGLGYEALAREIGHREQLIDELTATQSQLAAAERAAGVVQERERLAREIHDTVSQSLSSIIMLLHTVERADPGSDLASHRLTQAREAAIEALAETRQFIHALAPPSLEGDGITGALQRLGRQTERASGLHVQVTVPRRLGPVPTTVEIALLRVAQSSLANVVQHASASRADVTVTRLDDDIILDVVDDGAGFDLNAPRSSAGPAGGGSFGLAAMQERVEELGGTLVVESAPGRGTSVAATFTVVP